MSAPAENGTTTLLTAEDVAGILKVPKSWVYREVRCGRLPAIKLGPRYVRFAEPSIRAFIADRERGPTYRKYMQEDIVA